MTVADPHEPRAAVLTWDYRQGPNLDQLAQLITDLSGGRLHLRHVDADSDEVVIVLATTALDEAHAMATFERWYAADRPETGVPFPLDPDADHRVEMAYQRQRTEQALARCFPPALRPPTTTA